MHVLSRFESGTDLGALEDIGLGLSRSNGALGYAIDSIHIVRMVLSDSMPMYTGPVGSKPIGKSTAGFAIKPTHW
jgi:hypothetical protein